MAFAAMGKRGDEIGTAIVGQAALGRGPERACLEEQELPTGLQEAPGDREGDIVPPIGLPHRRPGKEIGLDCQCILVGNPGKARIGEYREIIGAVRPHPLTQGTQELRIGPPADAGLGIGGDVRAVERAEWGCQRQPTGIGLAATRPLGMAIIAARGRGEIGAARNGVRVGGFRRRRKRQRQEKDGEDRPYFLTSSRNLPWQAPQPFFPRSAKASCIFALSPPFTAVASTVTFSAAVSRAARKPFESLHTSAFGAYLPSGFGPSVPGGNTSGIFFIVWVRLATAVVALAKSPLSSR